ncbi:MAG: PQQ-binding-like beta-propeller repeat protein [Verrucomicrobiota bacterium]
MKYRCKGSVWIAISLLLATLRSFSAEPGDVLWTYSSGLTNHTDLALGPEGTIYLGSAAVMTETRELPSGGTGTITYRTNHLFAIDTDGQEKWQFPGTGENLAVRADGKILATFGTTGKIRVSVLPTGPTTIGNKPVSEYILSGINPDGSSWFEAFKAGLVAIAADNNVLALNVEVPDGSSYTNGIARLDSQANGTGWTNVSLPFPYADKSPVITPDGTTLYVSWADLNPTYDVMLPSGSVVSGPNPDFQNALLGFLADGTSKYLLFETNVNYSTPAIGGDGTLYLASGKLLPNGAESTVDWSFRAIGLPRDFKWSFASPNPFGPAAIDSTNNVYVGSGTRLYALTANGAERWTYEADNEVDLCPALAADGTVYAVTRGGKLLALDAADGSLRWSYDSGRPIHFPPTIGADGTVYILVDNSDLVAIEGTAPPANAPWPQDRHDAQRTNRATQASTSGLSRDVDGKFSLNLNLEPGRAYKVEASVDLLTWTEIGSITSSGSAQTFLDETSAGKPQRFYRLVVP